MATAPVLQREADAPLAARREWLAKTLAAEARVRAKTTEPAPRATTIRSRTGSSPLGSPALLGCVSSRFHTIWRLFRPLRVARETFRSLLGERLMAEIEEARGPSNRL